VWGVGEGGWSCSLVSYFSLSCYPLTPQHPHGADEEEMGGAVRGWVCQKGKCRSQVGHGIEWE
jgi:hypothetical protein